MASKVSARHAWSAVVSCCVMFVVWSGVCWNTATLYADPIIGEWGIERSQFMVSLTLISLGNALVSLLAYGKLVDKFGIRKLIVAGGVLSVIAIAMFASAQNCTMLYIAGLLLGIGYAPFGSNTANVVVGSWFKKKNNTLVGVVQTCGSVAGIVFAVLMTSLISELGWRMSYWATMGVVILGTVICYLLYKGDPQELGDTPMYSSSPNISMCYDSGRKINLGTSFGDMFRTPRFYCLIAGYLLVGIVGYAVLGSLALMASDFGYSNMAGMVVSIAMFSSAATMIAMGYLIDKIGSRWVVAMCIGCVVVAMVILLSGSVSSFMLCVSAVLVGIAYDATLIPIGASVREAFGERDYEKKLGFIGAFDYAGVAFGATILSLFYDANGNYQLGLIVFVGLALAGFALVFAGIGRQSKGEAVALSAQKVALGKAASSKPAFAKPVFGKASTARVAKVASKAGSALIIPSLAGRANMAAVRVTPSIDAGTCAEVSADFEKFMQEVYTTPCTNCLYGTCSSMLGNGVSNMCSEMCRHCSRELRKAA